MGLEQSRYAENSKSLNIDYDEMISKVLPNSETGISEFNLDALMSRHRKIEIAKDFIDPTRPLKDLMTKIIVKEFFKSQETLFGFLMYVYKTFADALERYREKRGLRRYDVFFVYKGGNILRMIANEFLLELPDSAIREISQFYAPYFKRGDMDFSIYVNPELDSYNDIHYEVGLISYLLQDKLRDVFDSDPAAHFDFFRYSAEWQQRVLQIYLDDFNQDDVETKITDLEVVGKGGSLPDVTIRFTDLNEDWLSETREGAIATIKDTQSFMRITHNSALDFAGGSADFRVKFSLVRTKIQFEVTLSPSGRSMNVGGELIDVSIPHRDESSLKKFFKDVRKNISTYSLTFDKCEFAFIAYSMSYLIHDLEKILFEVTKYPWLDKKYQKRLYRLFYLNFTDIFIKLEDSREKLRALGELDAVFTSLSKYSTSEALSFIDRYGNDHSLLIITMLQNLVKIAELVQVDDVANRDEFDNMLLILSQNVRVVSDSINNVREYCSVDGRITSSSLKTSNVRNFI